MTTPPLQTPQEMRAEADRLEIEARAKLARAKQLRRSAGVVERAQEKAARFLEETGLTSSRDDNTTSETVGSEIVTPRTGRQASESTKVAIGRANTTRSCLFNAWLAETDQTATSWALDPVHCDANGKPRWAPSAVRAWMMDSKERPKSARAVPEDAALLIATESKGAVPAVDASWPNGISRPRRRVA